VTHKEITINTLIKIIYIYKIFIYIYYMLIKIIYINNNNYGNNKNNVEYPK